MPIPMTRTRFAVHRLHEVAPLRDPRWQDLLQRHSAASVFHSVGWLKALQLTYGYEPVVFSTSQPAKELANGLLACRVRSWLTGKRIVSIPFSDHCAPLCDSEDECEGLLSELQKKILYENWKSLELRPICQSFGSKAQKVGFRPTANYILHSIDLEPSEPEIFNGLHKNCVQRRIRHAERAEVAEVCGKSDELLRDFYRLIVRTRVRHGLPPQPYNWFKNVCECLGDAADLRVAYKKNIPIAALLILHFKGTSYFKYACSDERFHHLGAVPFLLWRAILRAKSIGSLVFDLGRSDSDDQGLIVFKNHWTSRTRRLTYWTYPSEGALDFARAGKSSWGKNICKLLPDRLLAVAGKVLYRHIG